MKRCNIDTMTDNKIIDKFGQEMLFSSKDMQRIIDRSWFIFRDANKQKAQGPYSPQKHIYVFWEISSKCFKRMSERTCIGGGTLAATTPMDSQVRHEESSKKWRLYFNEPWKAQKIVKVIMLVHQKKMVKEMLSHIGFVMDKNFFYSPEFCTVIHNEVLVKPQFNLPEFRCRSSRHEYEEKAICVTFQILFNMKRHDIDAFESIVLKGVQHRFPTLRIFFDAFYLHCMDIEEKKLPGAHIFEENNTIDEASLKFFQHMLDDEKHHAQIENMREVVNRYLNTWKLQGAYRKGKIQDEMIDKTRQTLDEPVYSYLSIKAERVTLTLYEAYNDWLTHTPGPEKLRSFDKTLATMYTKSVDNVFNGLDKNVVCTPFTKGKPTKYIRNFRELIHCFWFMYNRFKLSDSQRFYNDNGKSFSDLTKAQQELLRNIEVTFLYRNNE